MSWLSRFGKPTLTAACLGVPIFSVVSNPGMLSARTITSSAQCNVDVPLSAQPGDVRVVHYNVRRFTTNSGKSAVDAVSQSLKKLRPAVVSLNEVDLKKQPGCLIELGNALELPYHHFFGHVKGTYGNALLSSFPISETRDIHLEGGTQVEHPKGSGNMYTIHRGMLMAKIELPEQTVTVAVTHLDHMDETERVVQTKHALREMQTLAGKPHMFLGDLNALCSADYSEDEWEQIQSKAEQNGWKRSSDSESIKLLKSGGYKDVFHEMNAVDGALREGPWKMSAHTDHPMYRIDYAFVSPQFSEVAHLRLSRCFIAKEVNSSDHFPVVVDFDQYAASKL